MTMTQAINPWQDLIQTCVLGSGRRQAQIRANGALGALISDLQNNDQLQQNSVGQSSTKNSEEEKILIALAATSLALRAGQVTGRASDLPPPPAPCQAETKEQCGPYAIALLNQALADQAKGGDLRRIPLVQDWLTFCRSENKIIVSDYLPRLLDFAKEHEGLHQLLADCGGNHMLWLLHLNKEWQEAYKAIAGSAPSQEALVEKVELGLDLERFKAFGTLREIAPLKALNCLVGLWEKESYEQKLGLLKLLKSGLSMDDEKFLEETALSDRRKEVRAAAAFLLALLPQSRLVTRMKERAECFVHFDKDKKLKINFPDEFQPSMAKDGIEETITIDSRIGQKAGWLYQTVSLVNPDFWREHSGFSAGAFLQLVLASEEWSLPMLLGLLNATAQYHDQAFQDSIIAHQEIHLTESQPGKLFLSSLPPEKLERLILSKLPIWAQTDRRSAPRLDLWYYLELVDFQWSEAFSIEILRFIIKEIKEKVPVFGHTFYSNAAKFGQHMHVGAGKYLDDLNLAQAEVDTWTRNGLERFVDTLKLRNEMYMSFKSTTGTN